MIKKIEKVDYYFLIILSLNIVLKLTLFKDTPLFFDSYTYLGAAQDIMDLNYQSYRAPFFPILIVPFLLLTDNPYLSLKLTSLFCGLGLIIILYFIFSKAAMKVFSRFDYNYKKKVKYVGLFVCFLFSFNLYLLSHSLKGLREELLSILVISIFYFTIVKENMKLQDNILLALSVSFISLTLLTAGIFITMGIILFYLISKLKCFGYKSIEFKKLLIIIISFILSFFLWTFFNLCKTFPPFYSLEVQSLWFRLQFSIDITSIEGIINASINTLIFGIPSIFIYSTVLINLVFILLAIYILIKSFRKKQFLFLIFFVGTNLAYLSVFITTPRIIIYFFSFFFYLGAIPLVNILFNVKNSQIKNKKSMFYLLMIFLITYILRGIDNLSIIYLILQFYNHIPLNINFSAILIQFYESFSPLRVIISIIFLIINELSLLIYIIKSRNLKNFYKFN
jgi:hypothetical protein